MSLEEKQWGNWRLEASNGTLVHRRRGYYVDLDRCRTSAEVLDWIFQIEAKGFGDKDVAQLIAAFRDLLDPQATLCSFGKEQGPIDVMAVAGKKLDVKFAPAVLEEARSQWRVSCPFCGKTHFHGADLDNLTASLGWRRAHCPAAMILGHSYFLVESLPEKGAEQHNGETL